MKIRVLFLAANPKDLTQLKLVAEAEEIGKKITASDFGAEIEIVPHYSTQPDDLIQLLNKDDDWQVVHYSGHGSPDHEILLVDGDGKSKPVGKEALAHLFSVLGRKARVVVFNACYAAGQAEAVAEHVDCAIGMSKPISDRAAILFAASFYRAIGFGKSVKEAVEQGRLAIELADIPEGSTPQLLSRAGVDPGQLRLVTVAPTYVVQDEWTRHAPPPPDLEDEQEWHAFLSYRSVNRNWVLNLYDVLQRHGYKLFLDQFAIQPGTPLVERLDEGLGKSRTGVLIWSTASADSAWCKKEYYAMQQRTADDPQFRFVTLRLGGELPTLVKSDVWIDFSEHPDGPNGGGLLRLLHALAGQDLSPQAVRFANEQDEEARQARNAIQAALDIGSATALIKAFHEGGVAWKSSSTLGCQAAEALTDLGAYDEALSLLNEIEQSFPRSVRPKQLLALALARRGGKGDLVEAQEILAMLRADGQQDPETLGIYARTWMDRYKLEKNRLHLRHSRKLYADAFEHAPDDTYTGINAAAKSVFLDEIDRSREYAKRVLDHLNDVGTSDYWTQATLGEAELILGEFEEAAEAYREAVDMAPSKTGAHRSTWEQARLLRAKLDIDDAAWKPIRTAFDHLEKKA